jgi:hypothetical protein
MQQSEETLKQVLDYARKRGHRPTLPQVRRYQQNGLIPKPRQIGLGRAKGTEVRYPPGTAEQLVAACKAVKSKSFRLARWRLWWDGWRIDPRRVRSDLRAQIRDAQKDDTLPRWIQRRLTSDETKRFQRVMVQFFASERRDALSDSDQRILAKGMGIDPSLVREMGRPGYWPTQGLGNILQFLLPSAERLKVALKTASDDELLVAREELHVIVRNLDGLRSLLDAAGPPSTIRKITTGLSDISPRLLQSAFVMWLSARQSPLVDTAREAIFKTFIQARPIEEAKG